MDQSQAIDLAVLIILLWTTISGASRGLVSQLSWAVALLLCFKFAGSLAPQVEPLIQVEQPQLRQWIAMLIVYLALCAGSFAGAGIIGNWLVKTKLSSLDRNLGALLGLLKGVVICMTIMYFLITVERFRPWTARTYAAYGAATILSHSQLILQLVPESSIETVEGVLSDFNQRLKTDFRELEDATPVTGEEMELGSSAGWDDLFDLSSDAAARTSEAGASGASESVRQQPDLERIMDQLPLELRSRLKSAALRLLTNSTPEEQQELLSSLNQSTPQLAEEVLRRFFRSQLEWDAGDNELLQQIAGIYPDSSEVERRAKEFLAGVPPTVRQSVVRDWHSDAMGLSPDPDSGTDINSRLDIRILRQLQRADIRISDLDEALRNRLQPQLQGP